LLLAVAQFTGSVFAWKSDSTGEIVMFTYTHIDHVAINTNDMEATLQFYCGALGMRLARTTRTPDGRRHYNIAIGGGNAFAVFDGAEAAAAGAHPLNHLSLEIATPAEFDSAYQRLKAHGIDVTEIIERNYGKTFYFHDPNGIRLQIEVKTKQDEDSLEGDPDPVPYVRTLLQQA
jgi:catechol 2,3-dioxygenase-like lactoylglutathione lyase family enzyme